MRLSRKKLFVILVSALLLLGVSIAAYFYRYFDDVPAVANESHTTLMDYDGEKVKLSKFSRRAIVTISYASWCTYCEDELKNLSEIKKIFGDDIDVIAVNRAEPPAVAKAYTDSLGLPPGIVFLLDAEDAFYKEIGGYAMPETIVTNRRGETIHHQHGPMTFSEMVDRIRDIP